MLKIKFGETGSVKELMRQIDSRFSNVFLIIFGDPGSGKTALAACCALEEMSHKRYWAFRDACKKIDYLNYVNNNADLEYPKEKHLVYSSELLISNNSPRMTTYDFDPWYVGIHDDNFPTQYFEKHSLRIFDEIQKYFPAQGSKDLPKRVSAEFQLNRHYDIFNIATCQYGEDVHYRIRRLASFIEVIAVETVYDKTGIVRKTNIIANYIGNERNFEKYIKNDRDSSLVKPICFEIEKNVFECYSSTSHEADFDNISNSTNNHDNFVDHSLTPPLGYEKKEGSKKGG